MLGTFSKAHGLAGLRVGWVYAPPGVAETLHRLRGPFNVARPALAAALAALGDEAWVERSAAHNEAMRALAAARLGSLGLAAQGEGRELSLL